LALPAQIDTDVFRKLTDAANEAGLIDVSILDKYYELDGNCNPSHYRLRRQSWRGQMQELERLIRVVDFGIRVAVREGHLKTQRPLLSAVHAQLKRILSSSSKSNEKSLLCIIRRFEGECFSSVIMTTQRITSEATIGHFS
jgi:hypothetical protein